MTAYLIVFIVMVNGGFSEPRLHSGTFTDLGSCLAELDVLRHRVAELDTEVFLTCRKFKAEEL